MLRFAVWSKTNSIVLKLYYKCSMAFLNSSTMLYYTAIPKLLGQGRVGKSQTIVAFGINCIITEKLYLDLLNVTDNEAVLVVNVDDGKLKIFKLRS